MKGSNIPFLVMRPKYRHTYNTIVQQYFKYVNDVTSVTMVTTECLERTLQSQFLLIIYITKSVTYHFFVSFDSS